MKRTITALATAVALLVAAPASADINPYVARNQTYGFIARTLLPTSLAWTSRQRILMDRATNRRVQAWNFRATGYFHFGPGGPVYHRICVGTAGRRTDGHLGYWANPTYPTGFQCRLG